MSRRNGVESFSAHLELFASDSERNTFTGLASRFGNLIEPQEPTFLATFFLPGCWNKTLKERAHKVKIYQGHETLIGRLIAGSETGEGLQITGKISETTDGKDTLALMRDDALNELSVAWIPQQIELLRGKALIEQLEKFRLSAEVAARIREGVERLGDSVKYRMVRQAGLVHVGIVEEGADDSTYISEVNEKQAEEPEELAVVSFKDLPLADLDTPWDRGKAVSAVKAWASKANGDIDFRKYARAFLYVDPDNADKQGGYKFPIATVADGGLKVVFRALASALGRLNQADISDDDKGKIRNHIRRYYKKFGKDFPDRQELIMSHEALALMTSIDAREHMRDLAQSLVGVLTPEDGEENPDMWACMAQTRYVCGAIMALADMPVHNPEAMSKLTGDEHNLLALKLYVIEILHSSSLDEYKESFAKLQRATTELFKSAGPQETEEQSAEPAPTAEPSTEAEDSQALLLARKNKIRAAKIMAAQILSGEKYA